MERVLRVHGKIVGSLEEYEEAMRVRSALGHIAPNCRVTLARVAREGQARGLTERDSHVMSSTPGMRPFSPANAAATASISAALAPSRHSNQTMCTNIFGTGEADACAGFCILARNFTELIEGAPGDRDFALTLRRHQHTNNNTFAFTQSGQSPCEEMPPKKGKKSVHPVFQACEDGDLEALTALLKETPAALEQRNGDGWTPLLCASFCGELDAVEFLLGQGADATVRVTASAGCGLLCIALSPTLPAGCLQRRRQCAPLRLCPGPRRGHKTPRA